MPTRTPLLALLVVGALGASGCSRTEVHPEPGFGPAAWYTLSGEPDATCDMWSASIEFPTPEAACLIETDRGVDGSIDFTTVQELDTVGRVATSEIYDGEGDLNQSYRYVWDDDDRMLERALDNDNDGDDDFSEVYTWDREALLSYVEYRHASDDVVREIAYVYRDDGRLDHSLQDHITADGVPDSGNWYEYGDNRMVVWHDFGLDGTFDSIIGYWFDEGCRNTRVAYDWDADGTIDADIDIWFDSDGRPMRKWTDTDGDIRPDRLQRYEYDDLGRLVRTHTEDPRTGEPDEAFEYDYTCE